MAYVIRPALEALVAELDAGRPVLVLQNFGLPRAPAWHYAVVVGYDRPRDQILLRSGATRRDAVATARFDATWRRADRWALVVVRPEDIPAGATAVAWLAAASELQATAGAAIAAPGYATAVRRWPDEPFAWFAEGNARLAAGDSQGAEAAFAAVLQRQSRNAPARNNLALLLARRGCVALARAEIAHAASDASGTPFEADIADSTREITARAATDPSSCPGPDAAY
jgi:tetratricopeptide (TPR) repeat protein